LLTGSSPALDFINMETEEESENVSYESSEGEIGSESEGRLGSKSGGTKTSSGSEGARTLQVSAPPLRQRTRFF